MNIWKHSRLSVLSFGGQPSDYIEIHKFLDSSKFYTFHAKHRALLHNTLGIQLCTLHFGDTVENSNGETIVIRDVAAQHLREDLSGWVPTIHDWFAGQDKVADAIGIIPESDNEELQKFIHMPYLQSGLKSSYIISCTDFGVDLARKILGMEMALELRNLIPPAQNVAELLKLFSFTQQWQYTPNMGELKKLN